MIESSVFCDWTLKRGLANVLWNISNLIRGGLGEARGMHPFLLGCSSYCIGSSGIGSKEFYSITNVLKFI